MDFIFGNYSYYPALRTRTAEIKGLQELLPKEKRKILPLISLRRWSRKDSLDFSLQKALEAMDDLPFLLDISKETLSSCDEISKLLSPTKGFENWVTYCSNHENVFPVVQMPSEVRTEDVVQQCKAFEQEKGLMAFRVSDFDTRLSITINALTSLVSPEKSMIFLDLGYIRPPTSTPTPTSTPIAAKAIQAIKRIRAKFPELTICILSSSFPLSVIPFCSLGSGRSGTIDILERKLYRKIVEEEPAIYGDYSSIHPTANSHLMGKYTPRIDVAFEDFWAFERRPKENRNGYIDAAKSLVKKRPEIFSENTWGIKQILKAASGDIEKMGSPSKWIAVRVNLHLTRQIESAESIGLPSSIDEEGDDFD